MTSDFDSLASIRVMSNAKTTFNEKVIADWLADICIKQADKKEKGFTYEIWSNKLYGMVMQTVDTKYDFLSECHDILDHTEKWHLKVFDHQTRILIDIIEDAYEGKTIYQISRSILIFKNLQESLNALGYIQNPKHKKEWIKVKEN